MEPIAVKDPCASIPRPTGVELIRTTLILTVLVNIFLFPFIWGDRNILLSARGAASILQNGALGPDPGLGMSRDPDNGGPAWDTEPLIGVTGGIYRWEEAIPLWNPYSAYGTPLAAQMHTQVFYPLTVALSLDPSPTAAAIYLATRLLIAGILMYVFLRLFLSDLPALGGSVAYMLTGYFVLWLNGYHLSVEILLPGIFYSFEQLLRGFTSCRVLIATVIIILSILGGAPEPTFLTLFLGFTYYTYRVVRDAELRKTWMKVFGRLAVVNIIGFASSSFLLVPFVEFMMRSANVHSGAHAPGLGTPFNHNDLFGYLVPLAAGPPGPDLFLGGPNGTYGYFGITVSVLAILAGIAWWRGNDSNPARYTGLVPFFLVAMTVMIMKRIGFAPVQWIGGLPLFRMIVLYKYLESLIGFCAAVLCGIGLSEFLNTRVSRWQLGASISVVLAMFLVGYVTFLPAVEKHQQQSSIFFVSTTASLLVLLLIAVVVLVFSQGNGRNGGAASWRRYGVWSLFICMTAELMLVFAYPVFYRDSEQPHKSTNAFSGAPYISWLQQRDPREWRTFGRNGLFFPNWPGVFGIYDVRGLDPMYDRKYLRFVRNFVPAQEDSPDLVDRFTGSGLDYSFTSPVSRRLLQLSSVRYMVTDTPFTKSSLASEILQNAKGRTIPGEFGLAETDWTIGGKTRHVLFQHPPSSPKGARAHIDGEASQLTFDVALNPSGYGGACGDGVQFMIDVRGRSGVSERVFDRFINPYGNPTDRKWFEEAVDLSRYAGQDIELLFSTGPGPRGDNCMDWAGWADLQLGKSQFDLVYNNEVQIYENRLRLPRAALFYGSEIQPSEESVLKRLVDPEFDIFNRALLLSPSIPPEMRSKVGEMGAGAIRPATSAKIVRMSSQEIDIDAVPDRKAVLVLNDTDYPGWKAYVDGKRAPILNADYLFRAVLLEAGAHHISFRYEPASFRLGLFISALALVGLALLVRAPHRLHLN